MKITLICNSGYPVFLKKVLLLTCLFFVHCAALASFEGVNSSCLVSLFKNLIFNFYVKRIV